MVHGNTISHFHHDLFFYCFWGALGVFQILTWVAIREQPALTVVICHDVAVGVPDEAGACTRLHLHGLLHRHRIGQLKLPHTCDIPTTTSVEIVSTPRTLNPFSSGPSYINT